MSARKGGTAKRAKSRVQRKVRTIDRNARIPRRTTFATAAAAAILPLLAVGCLWWQTGVHHGKTPTPFSTALENSTHSLRDADKRADSFLSWFLRSGGSLSPRVTLGSFPKFGGFGLLGTPPVCPQDQSECRLGDGEFAVRHLEEMFRVPPSIIITADSVRAKYRKLVPEFDRKLDQSAKQYFSSSMIEQDVTIALFLMVECSLGKNSFFHPYLDVMPRDVPRLDTFNDDELSMLQDGQLALFAKDSFHRLSSSWKEGGLRELAQIMAARGAKDAAVAEEGSGDDCLSFEAFHHFVAIVSSRAMVLHGVKHLTPLADMANYAPREDSHRRVAGLSQSFTLYHGQNTDGSISVRADRDVKYGDQIFEDYGDTDNSLYLEAHGFVPDENPFHCAMIPPEHLPDPSSLSEELLQALLLLKIMPNDVLDRRDGAVAFIPDVCVKADGTVTNERAADYLAIAALQDTDQDKCAGAVLLQDIEWIEMQCMRYKRRREEVLRIVRESARKTLDHATTTIENDLSVKANTTRQEIALMFRIAEKRLLAEVSRESYGTQPRAEWNTGGEKASFYSNSDLQMKADGDKETPQRTFDSTELEEFNAFIESLSLPTNKIEIRVVGDGMRLGAVAKERLSKGDIYISFPESSVISSDDSEVKKFMSSFSLKDDFDAMVLYLLHERFVVQHESKWWPYLRILPTVDELKNTSSLFFGDDKINSFLAGSDLRLEVLRYQNQVERRFAVMSSNYQVVSTLGAETMLDRERFYWANAILDSRSIWWNGKRHLVPLLDLVNCMEVYDAGGIPNPIHETSLDVSGNAITRASRSFEEGEQIVENYGQPNHVYFLYHGFILENNTHDCALWNRLSIDQNDKGAQDVEVMKSRLQKYGFNSISPTFCIRDGLSLHRVANFMRIKHGIINGDKDGLGPDVNDHVIGAIRQRQHRFDPVGSDSTDDGPSSYAERTMRNIVRNDAAHFDRALQDIESGNY